MAPDGWTFALRDRAASAGPKAAVQGPRDLTPCGWVRVVKIVARPEPSLGRCRSHAMPEGLQIAGRRHAMSSF
jgi:hypothetical protein